MSNQTSRKAIGLAFLLLASIIFQSFGLMGIGLMYAQKQKPTPT